MSVISHISGATTGQQAAAEQLQEFLTEKGQQVFLLTGYAGTGKTYLLASLIHYLETIERPHLLMAPTGRAAMVAANASGGEASTIHSTIYQLNGMEDRNTRFKLLFGLRGNYQPENTVYLVDEASMLSDQIQADGEMTFGSGKLLHDLIRYIDFENRPEARLVFIGDPAQLPPIKMGFSPALDPPYLKRTFQLEITSAQLTQLVRQEEASGIAMNALGLRQCLSNDQQKFKFNSEYPDVSLVEINDFKDIYLQNRSATGEETIVVAHANRQVAAYNTYIRGFLFPGKETAQPGDRLMIVRNNSHHEISLYNGQFATVVESKEQAIAKRVTFLARKGEARSELLQFRPVRIEVINLDGNPEQLDTLLLENVLYDKRGKLSMALQQALYVDFKHRHSKLEPGSEFFLQALLADPYLNALQARFGYAVTCHKAQGGEWKRVFVDFNTSIRRKKKDYFSWMYTAITRAKQKLYGMNLPWDLGRELDT